MDPCPADLLNLVLLVNLYLQVALGSAPGMRPEEPCTQQPEVRA